MLIALAILALFILAAIIAQPPKPRSDMTTPELNRGCVRSLWSLVFIAAALLITISLLLPIAELRP